MYDIDQLSNAAGQLTGEPLEVARRRLSAKERFDYLIPGASPEQGRLEAVLVCALGAVEGQDRPFGVRDAKPVSEGLVLRVARAEDVQAVLDMLPRRTRKGPWRGVRGLTVELDGARLRFGFRPWLYEKTWRTVAPGVWMSGPRGEDLAELLAAHEQHVVAAGDSPQWDPQLPEPGPKRAEPVARSLVRRLDASYGIGSDLLRRPRLWDSLAGYAGVRVETRMTDYGLDWIVERRVAGPQFDEARLIEVFTDHVVGCGLRLLDHACGAEECTVRLAPRPGMWGWRGVLTVRSIREAPAAHGVVPGPRPLTAIGERLNVSRPRCTSGDPQGDVSGREGAVVRLLGYPGPCGVRGDELPWVAEQIAAVWATQGLAAAVIQLQDRDQITWGDPTRPVWATSKMPDTTPGWRRLRLTPAPGRLWQLKVSHTEQAVTAALAHARRAFDRIILTGRNTDFPVEDSDFVQPDARLLVHQASPYSRHLPLPAQASGAPRTVELTAAESAVQWRQQELGGWAPRHPLSGLLLLTYAPEGEALDAFDLSVEEQLARYGMPVVGRFPSNRGTTRGLGHSSPATVLDPEADFPTHNQMISAVDAVTRCLWPEDARSAQVPDVVTTAARRTPQLES
ncbi:hypothetical protein [Streptomyces flavofungini]|uniref:hypothetical protein n=1 Tax=Streptomyces flavofungini TaxID=68200 RepID=UPI0025AF4156|nr:hypothetical protein [Streptomyces flavofungini]WJV51801.1 hypothetical protein QUY26_39950 [Streptomyces flavofungini]